MSAPGRSRLSTGVARFTSRLDQHKTLLGLLVLGIGAFLGYVAFISTTGPPFQSKYELKVNLPADAPVVREGQAVRVGGKLAGLISEVEPDREEGGTTVTANITKTEFRPMPEDTEAYVRVHSIVYETYLELLPGASETELENGDSIGSPAASGTDLLEVVQLFDAEARESLRETTVNAGYGVAGRGDEVNAALADLDGMARRLQPQLEAITARAGRAGRRDRGRGEHYRRAARREPRRCRGADHLGERDRRHDRRAGGRAAPDASAPAPVRGPVPGDGAARRASSRRHRRARQGAPARPSKPSRTACRLSPSSSTWAMTLREEIVALTAAVDPTLEAARPVIYGLFPTMTALGPLERGPEEPQGDGRAVQARDQAGGRASGRRHQPRVRQGPCQRHARRTRRSGPHAAQLHQPDS